MADPKTEAYEIPEIRKLAANYGELGTTGLQNYGGYVDDEWLRQLRGTLGMKVYREMSDNDPIIGAYLFSIEMLLRNVEFRVEPFDDDPESEDQAEFVESLMDDMSHTWADFISEVLSMLRYGFSYHEIVYKQRLGPDQKDPAKRSKHDDGLIGWRKMPVRSQDTMERWEFDDDGGIKGMWQADPTGGVGSVFIPIEKALLFRTTSQKNNPQGRSILRNAFTAWYNKKRIEQYEAIGIERDLAGLPVLYVPPTTLSGTADDATKARAAEYRKIVQNVRNDEQAGLVLPSVYDDKGNKLVEFQLLASAGSKQHDTTKVINRYERVMAMTVNADHLLLGHEKVGSYALSSDKTELFATALGAWVKEIVGVLNRHALPRLYQLNGWDSSRCARFVAGDIEKADVQQFAASVSELVNAGMITPGGEEDEEKIREMLDLPPAPTTFSIRQPAPGQVPAVPGQPPAPGAPPMPALPGERDRIPGFTGPAKDQQAALNGAQVAAMIQLVQSVADGTMPRASAIEILVNAFPISREVAERILGEAGAGFKIDRQPAAAGRSNGGADPYGGLPR